MSTRKHPEKGPSVWGFWRHILKWRAIESEVSTSCVSLGCFLDAASDNHLFLHDGKYLSVYLSIYPSIYLSNSKYIVAFSSEKPHATATITNSVRCAKIGDGPLVAGLSVDHAILWPLVVLKEAHVEGGIELLLQSIDM